MVKYKCVVDGKLYDPTKTRADYKGLCSMRCQHQLAREQGFNPRTDKRTGEWKFISNELKRRRETIPGAEPLNSLEEKAHTLGI